jgi:hypothetical protein
MIDSKHHNTQKFNKVPLIPSLHPPQHIQINEVPLIPSLHIHKQYQRNPQLRIRIITILTKSHQLSKI